MHKNKNNEDLRTQMIEQLRPVYSLKDHYKNLKMIEETIIRDTYGKYDFFGHSLEDCRAKFKENCAHGEKKYYLREFTRAIRRWKKDLIQTEQKIEDRKRFRKALRRHAENEKGIVLFDQKLSYQGITCTIDAILIVSKEMLLLNLKVPTGDSGIDEKGNFCWLDVSTVELAQVSIQNELRKQLLLMRMILDNSDVCHRISAALIVGGKHEFNSVFDDGSRELCFGRLEDMEKKISFAPRGDIFDEVTMQIIKQIIETWKVEEEKEPIPKEYDLIEAYCDLKERL